jgi:cyclomaltodextrin glucanotransferase
MKQAIALMFVSRGVPCVYYGMEQDLFVPNDPGDPYNRPMMASFDESSEMFRFVQSLIALRKSNPSLRYGSTHIVHETDNIVGFERMDGPHRVFFATSKNPRQGTDDFPMVGLTLPDGAYRDILSGRTYRVEKGRVNVSLADGGMMILSTSNQVNNNPQRMEYQQ